MTRMAKTYCNKLGNLGAILLTSAKFSFIGYGIELYLDKILRTLGSLISANIGIKTALEFLMLAALPILYKLLESKRTGKAHSVSKRPAIHLSCDPVEGTNSERIQMAGDIERTFMSHFQEPLSSDDEARLFQSDGFEPAQDLASQPVSDDGDRPSAVVDTAVHETARVLRLNRNGQIELKKNLTYGFEWLCQSIALVAPVPIAAEDEEKYISAIQNAGGFEIYQVALGTLENQLLKNPKVCGTREPRIVSEMMTHLYDKLEEMSKSLG